MNDLLNAVKGAKAHDDEAFQVLYEKTKRVALAVIKRYCDVSGDYEDILQETYLRVYQSIGQLTQEDKVQAWINRIAANTAIRHNMKKRPQLFSELADEEGNIPEFRDERQEAEPEIVADRKAVSGIVLQVMEELPEDQRDALWMVYGQKVTIREMAVSLGISENTIKSRLYQGRKKLLARREDFRKLGIELNIIPISVLVALAFREEVYAAVEIGAGAGTAAAAAKAAGKAGKASGPAAAGEGMSGASAAAGEAVAGTAVTGTGTAAAGTAAAGAGTVAAGTGAAAAGISAGIGAKLGVIIGSIGIGAKIAAVGAGAVIATGGGAFVASQVFPEPEAYVAEADVTAEEMGEDVVDESQGSLEETGVESETSAAGQDDSAEVLYDNEDNRQAIALYRQALTEDALFQPADTDTRPTEFAVFDLNEDGIYEMNVFVPGGSDADTYAYFCWYDSGEMHHEPLAPDDQQFLPEENIVISGMYQMGVWLTLYKFDGSSLTMTEQMGHEDPVIVENPEGMEEVEKVTSRAIRYNMVGVTEENLATYLSGSGRSTGQAEENGDVEEVAVETQAELEGGITSTEIGGVQMESGLSSLYVIEAPSAPLYAAPDSNSERIAWVPDCQSVTFEQYFPDTGYFQVSYREMTGYIESSCIDPLEPQIWNEVHGIVVNCQESIALYSYPSTDEEEICRLVLGTDVMIVPAQDNSAWPDFYHVSYGGMKGYVLASYIELYEIDSQF